MTSSPRFLVDVIVPIHTTERPLGRAVDSVHSSGLPVGAEGGVRILVVCHNVDVERIRELLSPEQREGVVLLERRDAGRTSGEPRNHGLDHVEAEFVSFLDSDDTLDPGALARWVALAREHGSGVVLPHVSRTSGRPMRTPVKRPRRTRELDMVKDRLVYRTFVVGLLRAAAIERLGLRFPEGFSTGEDQSFSYRLFSEGGRVDHAPGRPGYTVDDADEGRISSALKPLAEELEAFLVFGASDWLQAQPLERRRGYAVKVLRVHVFGEVTRRVQAGRWSAEDALAARGAVRRLLAGAPGAERAMSRADRDLLDLLERGGTDLGALGRAARARRRFGTPATLVPRDLRWTFHRDGSLRFMVASALVS